MDRNEAKVLRDTEQLFYDLLSHVESTMSSDTKTIADKFEILRNELDKIGAFEPWMEHRANLVLALTNYYDVRYKEAKFYIDECLKMEDDLPVTDSNEYFIEKSHEISNWINSALETSLLEDNVRLMFKNMVLGILLAGLMFLFGFDNNTAFFWQRVLYYMALIYACYSLCIAVRDYLNYKKIVIKRRFRSFMRRKFKK